jgi:ABC-type bacteriocin/lantibiotic exporter with double-glycine peptidase domain
MFVIVAFLETIGVASIMPFLAVLGTPDIVNANVWLEIIYKKFHFSNSLSFLFFLGLLSFVLLVLSNVCKAVTIWAKYRFINICSFSMSSSLFKVYLDKPYSFFLNQNSSEIGKSHKS